MDPSTPEPARELLRALVHSPGDERLASELAALADAHTFADFETTSDDIAQLWSLALGCVRFPIEHGQPPILKANWRVVLSGLSDAVTPPDELPSTVKQSLTETFFSTALSRLVFACRESAASQGRASETFAGVTLSTVTPDEAQPKSGKISDLRSALAAPAMHSVTAKAPAPSSSALVPPPPKRRPAGPAWSEEQSLRALVYWTIAACPEARPAAEAAISAFLCGPAIEEGGGIPEAVATRLVLQVILAILRGRPSDADDGMPPPPRRGVPPPPTPSPLSTSQWLGAILPLHSVSRLVSETTSVLSLFHEPLVKCLFQLMRICPSSAPAIVRALAGQWPDVETGNSPKGILLLLELDQVLRSCCNGEDSPQTAHARAAILAAAPMLCKALASDNSRLAQQALGVLHGDGVLATLVLAGESGSDGGDRGSSWVYAILAALWRGGQPHWNATVNKQTRTIIERMLSIAPPLMLAAAARVCVREQSTERVEAPRADAMASAATRLAPAAPAHSAPSLPVPPTPATSAPAISAPPGPVAAPKSRANPPLTITGVAPWAKLPPTVAPSHAAATGAQGDAGPGRRQPPVTITGVAPWAFPPRAAEGAAALPHSTTRHTGGSLGSGSSIPTAAIPASAVPPQGAVVPVSLLPGGVSPSSVAADPMAQLRAYLDALAPPPAPPPLAPAPQSGQSTLASAVASEVGLADLRGSSSLDDEPAGLPSVLSLQPALLPSLRFHDLAFGYSDLGSGAFSVVKYAKHINRDAPASTWAEYAVKVVSEATARQMGYGRRVRREVAVCATLTHPNIARLISAFRWREGTYLVLEYGQQGDLHGLLARLGSLGEAPARFLMSEALAALMYIHEKGFVYGDCKPENMVLVAGLGGGSHLKLTDMGACLPYSAAARALVAGSRSIIKNLRDGDWRAQAGVAVAAADAAVAGDGAAADAAVDGEACANDDDEGEEDEEEDLRVEGTSEFLAPEVLSGASLPTVSSDAYAFGVTLFQVLAGRLPDSEAMWGPGACASSTVGASHHVRFREVNGADAEAASSAHQDTGKTRKAFPAGFPPLAADLVRSLLHPDPAQRLGGGERGLAEVAEHPWFAPLLQDRNDGAGSVSAALASLHRKASPMSLPGLAAPDPTWSRRHYSSMWAPLPRAYTTLLSGSASSGATTGGTITSSASPSVSFSSLNACMLAEVLPPLSE